MDIGTVVRKNDYVTVAVNLETAELAQSIQEAYVFACTRAKETGNRQKLKLSQWSRRWMVHTAKEE